MNGVNTGEKTPRGRADWIMAVSGDGRLAGWPNRLGSTSDIKDGVNEWSPF
ncbi:hypothetical protein GCM10009078_50000 [Cupriavidus gilardii]